MTGAYAVEEITAVAAPLVVSLLCVFAYRRGIGTSFLLLWAAAHVGLSAAILLAVHGSGAAPPLADLPIHGLLAVWLFVFSNLAILFGVIDLEAERIGLRRGLSVAAAAATVALAAAKLDGGILEYAVLPAASGTMLVAAIVLFVRHRSAAQLVAGAVLTARFANSAIFVLSLQDTGVLDIPDRVSPMSVFLNFLTGLSLLMIAIDRAWDRLREMLAETRAAKAVSEAVLNVAPVSILQKDRELRIVAANPYAEDLAQRLSPDTVSILGARGTALWPGDHSELGEEIDRRLLADPDHEPPEYEASYTLSDGSRITLLVRKAVLRDATGAPFGTMSVSSDVTELKRSEQRMRELLEQAERANKIKTEFLAHMSHELRTPLNAINGFSEMLLAGYPGALNERQRDYVESTLRSSRHMLDLVSDILTLSHIETSVVTLERSRIDLGTLLREVSDGAADAARERSVTLKVDVPKLDIDADHRSIGVALTHLVENAIRFNREGGVVEIDAHPVDGRVSIIIADTGIGMTAEQLAASGNLLVRGDPMKARYGGGAGFGLAIARGLIELHGGRLLIDSRLGEGTTVTVEV